ncbi:MAG TPA: ATP-binding protein [Myxococcota bacterium]|nr:ATP-binding protein [Myxococcota bacterium]
MPLIYDAALLGVIGLSAWIGADIAVVRTRRRRLWCVVVLALAAFPWASGELLVRHATTPGDVLAARRILFAGVCALPAAWVWSALTAAYPNAVWPKRIFFLLLLVSMVPYATLYVAPGGVFTDWYAVPPRHGPLFFWNALYSWTLIVLGMVAFVRATNRSLGHQQRRLALILAATFVPIVANALHLLLHIASWDPTPIAIGISALLFRFTIVDLAWGAYDPEAARAEVVVQTRVGVLVADLTGRVVDWNLAALRILGTPRLEGQTLRALLAQVRALRGREIEVHEFPLERRGQGFGSGAVVTDRSEIRRAELRLEMKTRVEALGYLATAVAHEINNPLSYVSANLALLDRLVAPLAATLGRDALLEALRPLLADGEPLIADAREGTERIQRIVERLVGLAQAESSHDEPEELDILSAVEKAVALGGLGKGQPAHLAARAHPLPRVLASETDVTHIVLHLILNARQMGGEGVPIVIELRASEGGVTVRIADQGPGISERDLPHVFEPFFTTRRPSSNLGLGLSLCWELARRNGGRLDAENGAEGGAIFTLWLPGANPS